MSERTNAPRRIPEFRMPDDLEAFRADLRVIAAALPGPCDAHGFPHQWSEPMRPATYAIVDQHGFWISEMQVCTWCLMRRVTIGGPGLVEGEFDVEP